MWISKTNLRLAEKVVLVILVQAQKGKWFAFVRITFSPIYLIMQFIFCIYVNSIS